MLASTVRRLIIYVRTHGFTSECRILQAPISKLLTRIVGMRDVIHVKALSAALGCPV
jgi:hypothetical protein